MAVLVAMSCAPVAGPTTPEGTRQGEPNVTRTTTPGGPAADPYPLAIPGLASTHDAARKMVDTFGEEEARLPGVLERVLRVQRQIHQNPEFPFEEVETARLLEAEHGRNGAEVHRVGKTGFVAIYRGRAPIPAGVQHPVIAVRGELDAVRGRETADLPWASTKVSRFPGVKGGAKLDHSGGGKLAHLATGRSS